MTAAQDEILERRSQIEAPLRPELYSTLTRLATGGQHKFVVSLGGGSVPGLCGNVALLRILEELDLRRQVAEVWGTSAGAVVGGAWASGTPALEVLDLLMSLHRQRALDVRWVALGLSVILRAVGRPLRDGVIEGEQFKRTIAQSLRVRTFEECDVPFRCIACSDDGEARRKIFRRGLLEPAIFFSMSIPGIMIPGQRLEGETCNYYDGGLVEKTPLISPISEHARAGDERRLLLLGTHFGGDTERTTQVGFLNRFLYSIYALEDLAWTYQLQEARARKNLTLMILNPHIDDPALFDFGRVQANYLQAREIFADTLQNAKLALSFGST